VAVFETPLGQSRPDGARFSATHFNPPARPTLPLPNYYVPPLAINAAWSIIIVHKWNIIRQYGAAMLKHGILGLLNYADMTGYEIREIFNKSLNFFWQAQSSQIYRELRTLEKNGWITITTVEQSEKPNKNVCSITKDGRAELLHWLSSESPMGDTRVPLLMQVFFLGNRSKEDNIAYFEGIANACRQQLVAFSGIDQSIDYFEGELELQDQSPYWKMTADFGRRSLQMHIDWAEHCAAELRSE